MRMINGCPELMIVSSENCYAVMILLPKLERNLMEQTKLPRLKCLRCDYEWDPQVEFPEQCPGCRSEYWDTPKKYKRVDR